MDLLDLARVAEEEIMRIEDEMEEMTRELSMMQGTRDVGGIPHPRTSSMIPGTQGVGGIPHPRISSIMQGAVGESPRPRSRISTRAEEKTALQPSRIEQEDRPQSTVNTAISGNALVGLIEQLTLKSSLPPLEVVKFSGDPCSYHKFSTRYECMVGSQNLDEHQKMARLLQFVEGPAKQAIKGFDGVAGGLGRALSILKKRFGQPHLVAEACVENLTEGSKVAYTPQAICSFADKARTVYETLRSLNALNEMNSSNMSTMAQKLPVRLQVKWRDEAHRIRKRDKVPGLEDLVHFIEDAAETVSDPVYGKIQADNPSVKLKGKPQEKTQHIQRTSTFAVKTQAGPGKLSCYDCGDQHRLSDCPEFKSKSLRQRNGFVKANHLCFNCLGKSHFTKDCRSKLQCQVCGIRHATILHRFETTSQQMEEPAAAMASVSAVSANQTGSSENVALQVVPVRVRGEEGKTVTTLAMLDPCSQETFMRRSLADRLGIRPMSSEKLFVTTMAGESTIKAERVNFEVEAAQNPLRRIKVVGVAVENLNVSTARPGDLQKWSHLKDIRMCQVEIDDVTVLIGANIPEAQTHIETRIGREKEPFAVRTILGWSVIGPVKSFEDSTRKIGVNFLSKDKEPEEVESIKNQLTQFLEIDSCGTKEVPGMSVQDHRAVKMLENTTRQVDGRYEVGMLWKDEEPYPSLRRRLVKDPKLKEKYTEFMKKLVDKGYAKQLTPEEAERHTNKTWYLPHQAVINPKKPSKVRVVFDAAAKVGKTSLNNQLLQGPDLTNNLLGVLLRFREKPIAIVGDIEGMFLQVRVPEEDTEALRYLFWPDGNLDGPVVEHKMERHIFGSRDSPACCNYALKRTAEDSVGYSEDTVEAVHKAFYVDDHVGSVETAEIGIKRVKEISGMLTERGFRIRGWISNDRDVLAAIPETERGTSTIDLDLDKLPVSRTLGLEWDVNQDEFQFTVAIVEKPATKRGVLSTLSSLFDPMGFICPVILKAKSIMQKLWKYEIGWDEQIPEEERTRWEKWKEELSSLAVIRIPRCHLPGPLGDVVEISLHNFSDASMTGYGMCSYLRVELADGTVRCSLILGKARCAPVKTTTIPRLELQAARLAVRASATIRDELTYPIRRVMFWTDSTTVLQYINNESSRFHVYVANRVAEIRDATVPNQWRHCPGKDNPADDSSRGLSPRDLSSGEHRWWQGPKFLSENEDAWPQSQIGIMAEDDPEVKRQVCVHAIGLTEEDGIMKMIEDTQSWSKLKTKAAWVMSMGKAEASVEKLTQEMLKEGADWLIRMAQGHYFAEEINDLQEGRSVKTGSPLSSLRPMLVDGIMRVGGRLENAPVLSVAEKHPIVLPKKSRLGLLVLKEAHERLAHSGREHTLAESRKEFWVLGGRNLSKKTIRDCRDCRIRNARPMRQVMSALPENRLIPFNTPFTRTGCDLFGPLEVTWGRGSTTRKRWCCLFTCMVSRAVYLEVVPSLSADDFIMTLRQFISRRGPPVEISCDNGSNFRGGERELTAAIEDWNRNGAVAEEMKQRGIEFSFQPPRSPHMSGVWERLVGLSKRHLKALAGDRLLTDHGLRTFLAEAEAIMNGRPLCQVSEDPRDLEALTPNHFLVQRKVVGLPPGVFVPEDKLLHKEWKKVQYLANLYWQRFLKEYVPSLQQRSKWRTEQRNVREGDLVLLVEDGVKRGQWPLGRVIRAIAGKDGMVRSAVVKTADTELHRPIVKMCLLEAAEESPEDNKQHERDVTDATAAS